MGELHQEVEKGQTMRKFFHRYPVISILLVLLACVRFEYRTSSWQVEVPGLGGGVLVLCVLAVVLIFRIFKRVEEVCIRRGLLACPLRYKYGSSPKK